MYKVFSHKIITIVVLIALTFVSFQLPVDASVPTVRISDAVAGEPLLLETLPLSANTSVTFSVTKPNGLATTVQAQTDRMGIARTYLDGTHTRRAGYYGVVVQTSAGAKGQEAKLAVLPGSVSPERSLLTSSKTAVQADGKDTATIQLVLKDAFGNIIPDTVITLLATRGDQLTQKVSNITDARGEATFRVSSKEAGTVVYSVVNAQGEYMVRDGVRLSFYNEGQTLSSIGGNSLLAQVEPSTSLLDTVGTPQNTMTTTTTESPSSSLYPVFEASQNYTIVLTVPSSGRPNEAMDMTVEVFDKSGNPALDYRGTLIFESNDANATLPLANEGYTFTAENLAKQTFFRSLTFRTAGQKVVRVSDVDNPDLFGEQSIIITGESIAPVGEEIEITYPTSGLRTGESLMTVLATGPANRRIVAINDTLEVGELVSDANGAIRFELSNLTNGKHEVQLKAYDAEGIEIASSASVVYYIDSEAATVRDVYAEPRGPYEPEDLVKVVVESEPGLNEVQIQVENMQRQLVEDPGNPGVYFVEYRVPSEPGEYPVRVFLRDQYDNINNQETDLVLVVGTGSAALTNISAVAEGTSVDVSWDLPRDTTGLKEIQVSYGTTPDTLTQHVRVTTDQTMARIDGLQGETNYYVLVRTIALDDTVLQRSEVLSVRTGEGAQEGFATIEVQEEEGALSFRWNVNGAAPSYIMLGYGVRSGTYLETIRIPGAANTYRLEDLINGTTYYIQFTAYDASGRVLYTSDELTAIPGRGSSVNPIFPGGTICQETVKNLRLVNQGTVRFLQWDGISGVSTYRIYSGTSSTSMTNVLATVQGQTYYQLPTLDTKEQEYFFGVKGFCPQTNEESFNFSNILTVESGPALIFLGVVTLFATIWLQRRRQF